MSYGSDAANDGTYHRYPLNSTWDHIGDIDYVPAHGDDPDAYVVAPVEGDGGTPAAFHFIYANSLRHGQTAGPCPPLRIPDERCEGEECPSYDIDRDPDAPDGAPTCAQSTKASWVAYNPVDGLIYSSQNRDATCLNGYRYNLSTCTLTRVRLVHFRTPEGASLQIRTPGSGASIQGGSFSASGKLYLVVGTEHGGILIVDSRRGVVIGDKRVNFDMYRSTSPGSVEQELEGSLVWDFDGAGVPGMQGQVHVGMLDVDVADSDFGSDDELYFKHYRALAPEHL